MIWILAILLLSMGMVIAAAIRGPSTYDRILAANTFGTKTMVLIALMGLIMDEMMFLDIALVYALINFVTTIGFLKFFKHRSFARED